MNPGETDQGQFREAIHILGEGGLVIAPTETFYGILGDASSQEAVTRLLKLKKRGFGKPVPLIAGSVEIVRQMTREIPDLFEPLVREFWPGPLTLVMEAAEGVPGGITAGTGTIGIRIPAQSPALDLARYFRQALTATSANFEGQDAPRSTGEIDPVLAGKVDLVIDGGQTPGVLPSTVLNLIPDPPALIRSGVLGEEVKEFLRRQYQ